jgi:hypothetical protein
MRTFSRWMPPLEERRSTLLGWVVLAVLAVGVVAAEVVWPLMRLIAVGVKTWVIICNVVTSRHLRRLAARRSGEDIGSFARAFDRRTRPFDPWVVRATWDALQPYVAFDGGKVPIRPTDRLDEDLCIDPELQDDLFEQVAERAGRSQEHLEQNPLYGKVVTVGGFVHFVTWQPRVETAKVKD